MLDLYCLGTGPQSVAPDELAGKISTPDSQHNDNAIAEVVLVEEKKC